MSEGRHNRPSGATTAAELGFGGILEFPIKRKETKALHHETHFAPVYVAIVETAQNLWPSDGYKTAAYFAAAAGVSIRRAEQWLQAPTSMSGDALLSLFCSKEGERFMRAAMKAAPKPPAFWTRIEKQLEISDLRERLRELEGGAL
ncbi:MAG: hypothetical protein J0H17_01455 [Rhizobiales bacterium]|nr:hypothetical protein [Hyphomicrobiales bacterium]